MKKTSTLFVGNEKLTEVLTPYLNRYQNDILEIVIGKLESLVKAGTETDYFTGKPLQETIKYLKNENALMLNCTISPNGDELYNKLFQYMVEHKDQLNFHYFYQNSDHSYTNFIISEMAFNHIQDESMKLLANTILTEEKGHLKEGICGRVCSHCGCYSLNTIPYTYRNHCGSIGRSYECPICSGFSNLGTDMVAAQYYKAGTNGAIQLINLLSSKEYLTLDETLELLVVPADKALHLEDYTGDSTVIDNGYVCIYQEESYIHSVTLQSKDYTSRKYYLQIDTPVVMNQIREIAMTQLDLSISIDERELLGYEPNANFFTGEHSTTIYWKSPKEEGKVYQPMSQFLKAIKVNNESLVEA